MRTRIVREHGFSLVELLIYMLLSIVVLTMIGSILISSLRAENVIRTSSASANEAQTASQSLARGIHNASALSVTAPSAGISLLRSRSLDSTSAGAWRCEAWAIVDGQLRWTTSPSAITVPTSAAAVSTWTLILDGVGPVDSRPYFSSSADGRSIAIAFRTLARDSTPVQLTPTLSTRQPVPSTGIESLPCF